MSQARILVVEDDHGLREAIVDTLLLGGYDCQEADSGEAALLRLNDTAVDMVISDIQMGGMDGLTLLATIRQQYPQIPVLLMTAYANIDGAVRAMREGAIDYLAKPFELTELEARVKALEEQNASLKAEVASLRERLRRFEHLDDHLSRTGRLLPA